MKGFTLLEMLITITIWSIFFTLTAVNLTRYQPEEKVDAAVRTFQSYVLYARNLSLSGAVFKDEDGDGRGDVPYGYGLHFEAEESGYWLFADLYEAGLDEGNMRYDDASEDIKWDKVFVDEDLGVEISNIDDPDNPVIFNPPFDIFFVTSNISIHYYNNGSYDADIGDKIQMRIFYSDLSDINKNLILERGNKQIYLLEDT